MGSPIAFVLTAVLTLAFAIAYTEVRAKISARVAAQSSRLWALILANRMGDARLVALLEQLDKPSRNDVVPELSSYLMEGLALYEGTREPELGAPVPRGDDPDSLMEWIGEDMDWRVRASEDRAA